MIKVFGSQNNALYVWNKDNKKLDPGQRQLWNINRSTFKIRLKKEFSINVSCEKQWGGC